MRSIQQLTVWQSFTLRVVIGCLLLVLVLNNLVGYLLMDGIDFTIIYAAAKLSLSGHPVAAYSIEEHHRLVESLRNVEHPYLLAWFYPPHYLLFCMPLGWLPMNIALYVFIGISLCAFLYAIYKIAPDRFSIMLAMAFPGVYMNIAWGQSGFLFAAAVGLGLFYIETAPVIAGMMFGLLSFKPQYAVLPMVILFIFRYWQAWGWSAFFIMLFVALSSMVLGHDVWETYLEKLPEIREAIAKDWVNVNAVQVSIYTTIRLLTGDQRLSENIQIIQSILVFIVIIWVWLVEQQPYLKKAALATGVMLCTPYILQYDLVLLAVPLAFYSWDIRINGGGVYEILYLSILFFLPLLNMKMLTFMPLQIAPFMLLLLLFMMCRRVIYIKNN